MLKASGPVTSRLCDPCRGPCLRGEKVRTVWPKLAKLKPYMQSYVFLYRCIVYHFFLDVVYTCTCAIPCYTHINIFIHLDIDM